MPFQALAKLLILGGIALLVLGVVVFVAGHFLPNGLPGDIAVRRGNGSFYFPVVSCIVFSIVATVVLNVILRLFNR